MMLDLENSKKVLQFARTNLSSCIKGDEVLAVFERALEKIDSDKQWKEKISEILREFSDGAGYDNAVELLSPAYWIPLLKAAFPATLGKLDRKTESATEEAITATVPLGVVLHITPGNSFMGGLESALSGVLTGNANIVRLSQQCAKVTFVVQELLESCGLPKGQLQSVLWDKTEEEIENYFTKEVDGIVVWGGEQVISKYKSKTPVGVRFIEYGPKLSFSVFTLKARNSDQSPVLVQALSKDVCCYEQQSCSSTQVVFVQLEGESEKEKNQIINMLADGLDKYSQVNPPARKTKHEQIELLKALEKAKLNFIQKKYPYRSGSNLAGKNLDWVISWKDLIEPSVLYRSLHVCGYSDLDDLQNKLQSIRPYLQTVSLACAEDELMSLTEKMWESGVNRVVSAGRSTVATSGAPHDGAYILSRFTRQVSLETGQGSRKDHLLRAGDQNRSQLLLQKFLKSILKSQFYRRRFEAASFEDLFDAKNGKKFWKAFHKIPWLMKEDLYQHGPPRSSELLTQRFDSVQGAYLFTTGGSTGEPKYALYSRSEWDEVTSIFAREIKEAGIESSDRVANLFTGGGLWSAFIAVGGGIEKLGALNLPVGDLPARQVLEIFKNLNVTAAFGLPSSFMRLAHLAKEDADLHVKLPKILYGGEHMSEPMKNYIREVFGSEIIKSGSYAAVDAGCIGYQCRNLEGACQHALESYAYVEICNPETGLPVEPGKMGEIIVTNLSRKLYPIVRLRTGDRGRQINLGKLCECGSGAFTFELLGRSDDMVRAGGANIHVTDVDRLVEKMRADYLSPVFQLRVSKLGIDDVYELSVELDRPRSQIANLESLEKKVHEAYLEIADEVRHYTEQGFLKHFKINLVEPGSIPSNSKTHKIRRVIDERL